MPYNSLSWTTTNPLKPNLLLLGVEGYREIKAGRKSDKESQLYRDSIRTLDLESEFNVYTTSRLQSRPNLQMWHRHLPTDFSRDNFDSIFTTIFGQVRFEFIVIDHVRSPPAWASQNWRLRPCMLKLLMPYGRLILPNFTPPIDYITIGNCIKREVEGNSNPLWISMERIGRNLPLIYRNETQTRYLNPSYPFLEVIIILAIDPVGVTSR